MLYAELQKLERLLMDKDSETVDSESKKFRKHENSHLAKN
jgi:hypothetical protein